MAKDIYHSTVRIALEKDGWTITDDPFRGIATINDRVQSFKITHF